MNLYAQDGVNVSVGDHFSALAAEMGRFTWDACPYITVRDFSGHFRGPRGFLYKNVPPGCSHDIAPDGIGTKTPIIVEAFSPEQAAHNVLAMTCGDITRWGGVPLVFSNVLEVASLGEVGSETFAFFEKMLKGLAKAAKEQRVVMYKGETAEGGVCVGSENPDSVIRFNWAGFTLGLNPPEEHLITGKGLAPGQIIFALREEGIRCNGFSSVRKAFQMEFGDAWWANPDAKDAIWLAAKPAALYDRFLATANGWYQKTFKPRVRMTCIVHITGGGIPGKFGNDILFPLGLSAELNDLWEPPLIMQLCGKWRGMPEEEFYMTWNGGQGVLVAVPNEDTGAFRALAEEMGVSARVCGIVTKSPPEGPQLIVH